MAFSSSRVQMVFCWGGDLCASKCRLCLTPLVCVSWNGKAFWVDGWTLKVKSGSVLFFFCDGYFFVVSVILSYKSSRRESILTDVATSIVCLFWPEIARVESWSRGMMVYCFFAAFVHGRVDTWRQLQLFTYLGEWSASTSRSGLIFVLGGREDNKSTYPWIPIRTFFNAAKVFFCLPLCIDVGTLKRRETWPMCITSRNSDLATACRVQPY